MRSAHELATRLGPIQVNTREDLEVSRHVFRGVVAYVITDPINFRSTRLSQEAYRLFTAVRVEEPLADILEGLVREGTVKADGAEEFYRFVLEMHGAGFLTLPVSNADALYERYSRKQATKRRSWISAPLYFRIPLWNPDRFLERTMPIASPLFTRTAFAIWAALFVIAITVVFGRWSEILVFAAGMLRVESILTTWVVLVLLKLIHEFGHGYACRRSGGAVPEMGAYIILMTPCAYVDASASWGFDRVRDRQIVNFGGMYFESFIALPAIIGWAMLEPGSVRDVLFLIAITASVTTIGFNINPLMKFDGYHALVDATGMPNLQQRSLDALGTVVRRWVMGLPVPPVPRNDRFVLLTYGFASLIYRVTLIIAIATILAVRFGAVGFVGAGVYLAANVIGRVHRAVRWLVSADETAQVRRRGVAVASAILVGLPVCIAFVPIPTVVRVDGILQSRDRSTIHAPVAGTVAEVALRSGIPVDAGSELVRLVDPSADAAIALAAAQRDGAELRVLAAEADLARPVAAAQARRVHAHASEVLEDAVRDRARLRIHAPASGVIESTLSSRDIGRWIERGTPVAVIGSGESVVRVLMSGRELVDARPEGGAKVSVRMPGSTGPPMQGFIVSVAPAGGRDVSLAALTKTGGGRIAVDGEQAIEQAFFEIVVRVPDLPESTAIGSRATVRLEGETSTIGRRLYRRFRAFSDALAIG